MQASHGCGNCRYDDCDGQTRGDGYAYCTQSYIHARAAGVDGEGNSSAVKQLTWYSTFLFSHICALELHSLRNEGAGQANEDNLTTRIRRQPRPFVVFCQTLRTDVGGQGLPIKETGRSKSKHGLSTDQGEAPMGMDLLSYFEEYFYPVDALIMGSEVADGGTASGDRDGGAHAQEVHMRENSHPVPSIEELREAFCLFFRLGETCLYEAMRVIYDGSSSGVGVRESCPLASSGSVPQGQPVALHPPSYNGGVIDDSVRGGMHIGEGNCPPMAYHNQSPCVLGLSQWDTSVNVPGAGPILDGDTHTSAAVRVGRVSQPGGGPFADTVQGMASSDGITTTHTSGGGAMTSPFPSVVLSSEREAMGVLQYICILAFSCPCAPLSAAAQLVLAKCTQRGDVTWEDPAGWWMRSLPHISHITESTPCNSTVGVSECHSKAYCHLLATDRVLWFDEQNNARVDTFPVWRNTMLAPVAPRETGREAIVSPMMTTAVLPTVERVLVQERRGVEKLLELWQQTLRIHRAVATPSNQGSLCRRRQHRHKVDAGGGGLGLSEAPGDASASLALPSTGISVMPGRRRRLMLLHALSHAHLVVPRPLRMMAKEIAYGVYTEIGEFSNYFSLLSLFPEVLRTHYAALHHVFLEDGPLQFDVRLMVAIMVASRHRCAYLVTRYSALLVRYATEQHAHRQLDDDDLEGQSPVANPLCSSADGDNPFGTQSCDKWLLHGPPARLQTVQRFIGIAVHVPWQLSEADIRELLQCGWSVPAVFQLIALVAHVAPLCSFVMGMSVPIDPWAAMLLPQHMMCSVTEEVGTRGNKQEDWPTNSPFLMPFTRFTGVDGIVSEQRIRSSSSSTATTTAHTTLWRSRFNWQEMGDTLMEQYYPGEASLVNDELDSFSDLVRQLSEADCVGMKGAKYSASYAFRSLQLYVMNLLGFMVEDYSYNGINKVLLRPVKWFAQVLTLKPETLTPEEILRRHVPSATGAAPTFSVESVQSPRRTTECSGADMHRAAHKRDIELELLATVERPGSSMHLALPVTDDRVGSCTPLAMDDDATATADEEEALQLALSLQEERVLLLTALAVMESRKEGLLHILLHPLWGVLNHM